MFAGDEVWHWTAQVWFTFMHGKLDFLGRIMIRIIIINVAASSNDQSASRNDSS